MKPFPFVRAPLLGSLLVALSVLFALAKAPRAQAPAAAAQAPASVALTAAQVEALVQRAVDAFHPQGLAVAVVQDGELLCELGRGERAAGAPVTAHTLFNIASCSKAFTAALVAQLVQEGKLAWNDRVVDRLPEFRLADPWITAHMTIADLLSHRCGLATFAGDLLWYGTDYSDAEVLRRLERLPITQRFREEFGYQNLMYLAAGLVLQRATGQTWEDLVEQRLLQPLGMTESRACAQRLPNGAEVALPHIDGKPIADHVFTACKPAAAIYASGHDLSAWVRALLAGGKAGDRQLLTTDSLRELWRPHVVINSGIVTADQRTYGMGWFLAVDAGKKIVEHDGGMPGFLSKVTLVPADKFGFVLLNNANDGVLNEALKRALLLAHRGGDGNAELDRIATARQRMLAAEKTAVQQREAARIQGTQPSLPLAAYAGRYEDAVYGPAVVELQSEQLHVTLLPTRTRLTGPLVHWHHDTFRVDFPDRFLPFALVTFARDSEGKVRGFAIDCPIADFDFGALDFRRQPAAGAGAAK